MRGLLVFNPEATSVSARMRDVIAHALAAEMTLEVAGTKRREHATHLARGAAHEGFDLLIVLGGDGTTNEVINGLAGTDLPMAALPGGGTNVFARTLGLPRDPIEATSVILERIADGAKPRAISLGRVNGRAFGFNAGVGFDAAVVHAVDRRFRVKQAVGEPFFVFQAVRTLMFAYPRKTATMTLIDRSRDPSGVRTEGLREVIVCNSDPYTFLGTKPFRVCPKADPELGLDVTALTSLRSATVLGLVSAAFRDGRHLKARSVRAFHDLSSFQVECARPVPYQVDGEYAGEDTVFRFTSEPDALRVIA